tara:strand:- start:905 stop:1219 length:315 start_codon:yes stop_codon:yes gene_type:complete
MTDPSYVSDINQVYTSMYNPQPSERVLEEKNHDYDIPKWARLLHKHKQEKDQTGPPHIAHIEPEADAEESNEEPEHKANQYVDSIIDIVKSEIKKAFIAGTKAN